MSFKKVAIVLLLIFVVLPTKSHAQTSNAGFVSGNIWYSVDPFSEGDKVKIYTLIFNPDSRKLSGTVIFFDNNVFLGKKDFIAEGKGVKDVSIDWTATVGDHSIFGKIENAKFLISKEKYEDVYLTGNETSKSLRTVSKKIIVETTNPKGTNKNAESLIANAVNAGSESVKNIEKIIEEKTPDFIAKPAALTGSVIEGFRSNLGTASENKKESVQSEIKIMDSKNQKNAKTLSDPKNTGGNTLLKPFKYAELFFFGFLSFIFNNKIIFYGISAIIIFFVLRYIWRLVF